MSLTYGLLCWVCTNTQQLFYGTLSGTSQVSQYQKKHSPTLTYHDHQQSFISLIAIIHSIIPVQSACSTIFLHNFTSSFLWPISGSGTLHFILHTFLHPVIIFATHAHTMTSCFTVLIRRQRRPCLLAIHHGLSLAGHHAGRGPEVRGYHFLVSVSYPYPCTNFPVTADMPSLTHLA